MAFDGITVAALVNEMQCLIGGRISKIAQPEADELLLTIKTNTENKRLLISASASLPFFAFTDENKPSPMTAPAYCMTLRKHISGGRITGINQLGLERIVEIHVDHLNEMGDPCTKKLILEMMGKYSNIIFCDEENMIIDSIKHVPAHISSLREVLPGRKWYFPDELQKANPLNVTAGDVSLMLCRSDETAVKSLINAYSGISGAFAVALADLCCIDSDIPARELSDEAREHISHWFCMKMNEIKDGEFNCRIFYSGDEPKDIAVLDMGKNEYTEKNYISCSSMIYDFFIGRSNYVRMNNKSADIRKVIKNLIERCARKIDIQEKQLKSTEKKDDYQLYGELLAAYAYSLPVGEKKVEVENYYDGSKLFINVDPDLSIIDNSKKYYQKYNKAKRMEAASKEQLLLAEQEMDHLLSLEIAIRMANDENDLKVIQREMRESGYIKKNPYSGKKGEKLPKAGKPYHYVTEDGYHIYVGRNNYQNEELTFEFANGNDMWFHSKGIPGSHVIVKTNGEELPDHIYEIAGGIAAYYSSDKSGGKVDVDYITRKNVKKAPGQKPGFVIYHTNYSLVAVPSLDGVTLVKE